MTASTLSADPPTPCEPGLDPLPDLLDDWLGRHQADLVALRRHLHAHPELSGHEQNTAAHLAGVLTAAGLTPRLLPTGNGVLCEVGPDDPGTPLIALRGDIDALPMDDVKDVPYRSTVAGACHACGHDVHATVVAGTGLALAELAARGQLPGRVRLLLQPTEEKFPSGAPQMVAAGGLADARAVFAFHCDPKLPTGLIGVRSGPLTAAADMMRVRLSGAGGHTARPHLTADLVHALAKVVVEVPALVSRRADPRSGISVVFGAVHAGQAANAIPREGTAEATVRVLDRAAWGEAPALVEELVHAAAAGTGTRVEVDYRRGVPPVVNDHAAAAIFGAAAAAALGPEHVVEAPISMGGEDFAWYLEHVPGAMARLGVGRPGEQLDLHQPNFDVDEAAIGHGVRVLVHTALAALTDPAL